MDSEEMMRQFEVEASQRIDELTPEERNVAKEFMTSPAAAVMMKVLGPNFVSSLPVDKLSEGSTAEAIPTGLASPTTPTEISAEAAAPVAAAPVRTGLAARPMQ